MIFSQIAVLLIVTVISLLKLSGNQLLSNTIPLGSGIVLIMGMVLAISLIEILSIMRHNRILESGISEKEII